MLGNLWVEYMTKKALCCDVPHRIEENVSDAIYVEAPLNQVDAF